MIFNLPPSCISTIRRQRISPSRRNQGVALVLVLACLALIITVTVAFMVSMRNETASSRSYSDGINVRLVAENATEMVKNQLLEGTTRDNVAWASQPGAIRNFNNTDGALDRVYKLYSSDKMIDSVFTPVTGSGASATPTEVPADWNSTANQFRYTDLNIPVTTSTGTTLFPILDPANFSAGIAGLSLGTGTPNGTSVTKLPMPVQWLYVLKSGAIKSIDAAGKVAGATTADPIVGRVAFWADDETCKININTAGEGTFWDVPRGDSVKTLPGLNAAGSLKYDAGCEKAFIAYPPVQREYQRYPGHPSQVSLKSVFTNLTAEQIYTLTPRVQSDDLGSNFSETDKTKWRDWSVTFPNKAVANTQQLGGVAPLTLKVNRLYASLDELAFTPTMTSAVRDFNQPTSDINPSALSRYQFTLTAYNRAPELNLFNKPRISMWPVPNTLTRRTPIDKWFARCSTLGDTAGGKAFYFTREQSQSPTFDYANITRNRDLFSYLQQVTSAPLPGYGGNFNSKFGADRDQILTEMFDYIRCINLADLSDTSAASPNVVYAASRNIPPSEFRASIENSLNFFGFGQVVPIQIGSNRGFGRFDTVAEVSILFYPMQWDATKPVRAGEGYPDVNTGTDTSAPAPAAIPANAPLYRALVLVEPFNPSQGFYPSVPDYQIQIKGLAKIGVNGSSIGFSDDATNVIRGGYNNGGIAGGSTGNVNVGTVVAPFDGWTGGAAGKDGTAANRPIYPFMSKPFPIAGSLNGSGEQVSASTFKLHGSTEADDANNIEITIKTKDGIEVQKLNVTFPKALNLPTPGLDGTTEGNQRAKRIRTVVANSSTFLRSSDILISLEPSGVAADMRWLVTQSNTSANAFVPHKNYQNPAKASTSDVKGADSLRTLLRDSLANSSATFGSLVTDLITGSPADISSNINGAFNSMGDPGDWDTGFGDSRDGPYINKPDEPNCKYWGSTTSPSDLPYYNSTNLRATAGFDTFFAPNRMVPSPGMLGSLPSRLKANGPWETLLFNPNPAAGDSHRGFGAGKPNGINPPDYLWLDLFTMPIIEPYAISEPFSTAGKINLNYQLVPFTYITRSTALNAVLTANRVTAIHDSDGIGPSAPPSNPKIKKGDVTYDTDLRHLINIPETLKQFEAKFENNGAFKSAAEICSLDLYPLVTSANMPKTGAGATRMSPDQPTYSASRAAIKNWWATRRLTGDNVREQPYTALYQNLTTQSNTFTVYMKAQTIKKVPGSAADTMTAKDVVTGEYQGSTLIERYMDPNDPSLNGYDGTTPIKAFKFRTISNKQFAP